MFPRMRQRQAQFLLFIAFVSLYFRGTDSRPTPSKGAIPPVERPRYENKPDGRTTPGPMRGVSIDITLVEPQEIADPTFKAFLIDRRMNRFDYLQETVAKQFGPVTSRRVYAFNPATSPVYRTLAGKLYPFYCLNGPYDDKFDAVPFFSDGTPVNLLFAAVLTPRFIRKRRGDTAPWAWEPKRNRAYVRVIVVFGERIAYGKEDSKNFSRNEQRHTCDAEPPTVSQVAATFTKEDVIVLLVTPFADTLELWKQHFDAKDSLQYPDVREPTTYQEAKDMMALFVRRRINERLDEILGRASPTDQSTSGKTRLQKSSYRDSEPTTEMRVRRH